MLQYNLLDNNFTIYENVEAPKVQLNYDLLDPVDISDWASSISSSGTPIVQDNIESKMIVDNPEAPESDIKYSRQEDDSTKTSTKTRQFNKEYSDSSLDINFEELIKQEKLPIKITSGYRNTLTAQGRPSNHSRRDAQGNPMAYDIVPLPGYTFDDLRKIFYDNPRVVAWFKRRNWGILEEMQDGKSRGFYDIRGKFHYTKASGPHFHLGPDKYGREWFNSKIAKGQQGFKVPFTTYKSVENPTVDIPILTDLFDNQIDISDWSSGQLSNGAVIVKDNIESKMIVDNPSEGEPIQIEEPQQQEQEIQQQEVQPQQQITRVDYNIHGPEMFEKAMNEVSSEPGYEGLKDPNIRQLLTLQALRESRFKLSAHSTSSTALGYFQFIDSTRRKYSSVSKSQFMKDPKEQIRAAYKLLLDIHRMPNAKKLLQKGYNMAQVTALGWWYPASMKMVLQGQNNFSKGGYSIKQALENYK